MKAPDYCNIFLVKLTALFFAVGVEHTPTEMEKGKIDVSTFHSPYSTREVSFSEESFDNLVKLTDYNILNNENLIVQALRAAVERRKQQKE